MKKALFCTFASLFLTVFLASPVVANETGCLPDEVNACCEAWQTKFDEVDKEYIEWWDEALNKAVNTSDLVQQGITTIRAHYCDLRAICKDVQYSYRNDESAEAPTLRMLGCFTNEDERKLEVIEECQFNEGFLSQEMYEDLIGACHFKARLKFEEEKTFFKKAWRRDAAHKKTAFLVARMTELLQRIKNDLLANVEEMTTNFDKLIHKIGCTVAQCD